MPASAPWPGTTSRATTQPMPRVRAPRGLASSSGPRGRSMPTRPRGSRVAISASSRASSPRCRSALPTRFGCRPWSSRVRWAAGRVERPRAEEHRPRPGAPPGPGGHRHRPARRPAGATGREWRHPLRPARARRRTGSGGAHRRGRCSRCCSGFASPFWHVGNAHRRTMRACAGSAMRTCPGGPVPTWWTTAPIESGVLTGWAGGPLAQELSALAPDVRRARALESLERLFGLSAPAAGGAARRRGPARLAGRPVRPRRVCRHSGRRPRRVANARAARGRHAVLRRRAHPHRPGRDGARRHRDRGARGAGLPRRARGAPTDRPAPEGPSR